MRTAPFALALALLACDEGSIDIVDELSPGGDPSADTTGGAAGDTPTDPSDTPSDTTEGSGDPGAPGDTPPPEDAPWPVDYSAQGPLGVRVSSDTFSHDGCDMRFKRYTPDGAAQPATVILTHGWMRNNDQMVGWARHLASWGYEVIAPNLCHATVFDTDHEANARDLTALVQDHLQADPVVLIGHSAGGLGSVLTALSLPATLGVLGLDMVDTGDLGLRASPNLRVPFYGLVGEPSWSCNSDNNGVDVLAAAATHRAMRVTDTTHCDFENPTDNGCTSVCNGWGGGGAFTDAQQRDTIALMMTAFVFAVTDVEPRGFELWTPGEVLHDELVATDILSDL
jgi:pimeloyl-ACP methyl ester carboxylesterase